MSAAHLHAFGRYRPKLAVHVDFIPYGQPGFSRPGCGQNSEQHCGLGHLVDIPVMQSLKEVWQFLFFQGSMADGLLCLQYTLHITGRVVHGATCLDGIAAHAPDAL